VWYSDTASFAYSGCAGVKAQPNEPYVDVGTSLQSLEWSSTPATKSSWQLCALGKIRAEL